MGRHGLIQQNIEKHYRGLENIGVMYLFNWVVYKASYSVNSGTGLLLEVLSPYQQYVQGIRKVFRPLDFFPHFVTLQNSSIMN